MAIRSLQRGQTLHEEVEEGVGAGFEADLRVGRGANVLRAGPSSRIDRSRESLLVHADRHRLNGTKLRLNHESDGHGIE